MALLDRPTAANSNCQELTIVSINWHIDAAAKSARFHLYKYNSFVFKHLVFPALFATPLQVQPSRSLASHKIKVWPNLGFRFKFKLSPKQQRISTAVESKLEWRYGAGETWNQLLKRTSVDFRFKRESWHYNISIFMNPLFFSLHSNQNLISRFLPKQISDLVICIPHIWLILKRFLKTWKFSLNLKNSKH